MDKQVEVQNEQNKVADAVNEAISRVLGEEAAYAAILMFQHKDEGANIITVGSRITERTAHASVVLSELLVQALNNDKVLAELTDKAEQLRTMETFDA